MSTEIVWTKQAQEDLRSVRNFIARDAPATAAAYVRRIRLAIERLRDFPFSGHVVPELGRNEIREILFGNYRILHRVTEARIEILAIFHGAKFLDGTELV